MVTRVLHVAIVEVVILYTLIVKQYEHDDCEMFVNNFQIVTHDTPVPIEHVSEHDVVVDDESDSIVNQNYDHAKNVQRLGYENVEVILTVWENVQQQELLVLVM